MTADNCRYFSCKIVVADTNIAFQLPLLVDLAIHIMNDILNRLKGSCRGVCESITDDILIVHSQ